MKFALTIFVLAVLAQLSFNAAAPEITEPIADLDAISEPKPQATPVADGKTCECENECTCGSAGPSSSCGCKGACQCGAGSSNSCGCKGACQCGARPSSSCGCKGDCTCGTGPSNRCGCEGDCTCGAEPGESPSLDDYESVIERLLALIQSHQ